MITADEGFTVFVPEVEDVGVVGEKRCANLVLDMNAKGVVIMGFFVVDVDGEGLVVVLFAGGESVVDEKE
jgi:hypothetical protein